MGLSTKNGSYLDIREYPNGQTYLKLRIPVEDFDSAQLKQVSELIEKIEDNKLYKKDWLYYVKKDIQKFTVRYIVSNIINGLFVLMAVKMGLSMFK